MIELAPKLPDEVRRYRHDWSPFLGTAVITNDVQTDTTVDAESGVVIDSVTLEGSGQSVIIQVSGGDAFATATITQRIESDVGDEETEVFTLLISAEEPISLLEARDQLNITTEDYSQDNFIATLITDARAYVEKRTGYSFIAGPRVATFPSWGDYLEIYARNIASIETITYVDENGDDIEFADYLAPLSAFPFRIHPGVDDSFPDLAEGGSIVVEYTQTALSVGSREYRIGVRAMKLLIAHWFDNRGNSDIPDAVKWVLEDLTPASVF